MSPLNINLSPKSQPYVQNYGYLFCLLLFLTLISRLVYANFPNLTPQEAYYWLYSQHLDLSYFDHPPLTAWTIRIFTQIGGDSHFFVRFGAILYSTCTAIIIYLLSKNLLGGHMLAFWTVVLMNCTVLFAIGAVIFTPDVPMTLFWTLVVFCVFQVMNTGHWGWWYPAGIFLGAAFLSKYPAGLLVGCTLLFLILSPRQRHWLWNIHPYLAIAIALLVFSPVIIWNMEHEWASFAFQSTRRASMVKSLRPGYFFQLLGSQLALVTPLIFMGMIYSQVKLTQRWLAFHNERILFILCYSLPVLLLFFLVSLTSLVKMNWLAPAYITGTIGMVLIFSEKLEDFPHIWLGWIRAAIVLGLGLVLVAHLLPLVSFIPIGRGDTWSGLPELAQSVEKAKRHFEPHRQPFVFTPSYKISSQLIFYSPDHEMTYAENIIGKPALQFDYWLSPQELIGRDAILVTSDVERFKARDRARLEKCFERVELGDSLEIKSNAIPVRKFYLSRCFNYKGPQSDNKPMRTENP